MALTPEDVVKKEFTKPKGFGKNGYDEIQVDDFLDEIVVELRRLNAENDELSSQLADCRRASGQPAGKVKSDAASSVPVAATGGATAAADEKKLTALRAEIADAERELKTLQDRTAAATVSDGDARKVADDHSTATANLSSAKQELTSTESKLAQAKADLAKAEQDVKTEQDKLAGLKSQVAQAEKDLAAAQEKVNSAQAAQGAQPSNGAQALAAGGAAGGAAGVIALAQKLHDEHVREGETTRDKLISEAQAHHDKVVGEATARHDELLRTGQSKYDEFLSTGKAKHDELVKTGQGKHDELVTAGQTKHDELVKTGQGKHDELVTAGQTKHDELVKTGQGTHDHLVKTANEERTSVLTDLTNQRDGLNGKIESLRGFENDYRTKLRGYIEGQLEQLKSVGLDDVKQSKND